MTPALIQCVALRKERFLCISNFRFLNVVKCCGMLKLFFWESFISMEFESSEVTLYAPDGMLHVYGIQLVNAIEAVLLPCSYIHDIGVMVC